MCKCVTPNFCLASILAATKLGICQAGFSAMALRAPLMKNSPRAELASSEGEMGKTKRQENEEHKWKEFRDVGVLHDLHVTQVFFVSDFFLFALTVVPYCS